ncbi:hypothetical protein GGR53DRAFT_521385 [Hypoxylon sp. FL1150]|nr:hypothetical protein GGR53DRAFT_521385 [Hypoxylon sp. FL1150]
MARAAQRLGTAPTTLTSASSPSAPGILSSRRRRPLNAFFISVFLALAAAFTWLMRVDTALNDVPVDFLPTVESGRLADGTPLVARYTGVGAIDDVATILVAALQQTCFLFNWFAVVCVWVVEASRRRNAGKLLSCVTLFSLTYQLVGGGVIVPLYYALYVYTSGGDAYHLQDREVPIGYARAILPSALLGYLAPAVGMYYVPWGDLKTVQYATALWQPFPVFICVLLFTFSFFLSSISPSNAAAAATTTNQKDGDVKHLKIVYLTAGLMAAAAHASTVYMCATSSDPRLSFAYVFLPDKGHWKDSMALGWHYFFQWDFWGVFGASLAWSWLVVYDVQRLLTGSRPTAVQLVQTLLRIALVTLVAGPGTAIVTVWNWREDRLVMIENGGGGTTKKPKAT